MLKDLNVSSLTGTATIKSNGILASEVELNRPCRSIGQMFFKPYESDEEFIYCAQSVLRPAILIGCYMMAPIVVMIIPLIYMAAANIFLLISGVNTCMGNDASSSWWSSLAEQVFSSVLQEIIDLLVLPLTAIALITRSISTKLKAADIYDYDSHHSLGSSA